jgi:hypothetical protein
MPALLLLGQKEQCLTCWSYGLQLPHMENSLPFNTCASKAGAGPDCEWRLFPAMKAYIS